MFFDFPLTDILDRVKSRVRIHLLHQLSHVSPPQTFCLLSNLSVKSGIPQVRIDFDKETNLRSFAYLLSGYFFRNCSGSMLACLRMARSVPSGISPG